MKRYKITITENGEELFAIVLANTKEDAAKFIECPITKIEEQ